MDILSNIFNSLKSNEIFSGVALGSMATTMLVGILYSLKQTPRQIWIIIKRLITVKLEIHSDHIEYKSFTTWVQQFNSQNLRSYILSSNRNYGLGESPSPFLNPGTGTHFVWYKKRLLLIEKKIETKNTNTVIEFISITTIALNPTFIINIFNEIMDISLNNNMLKIYNIEDNDYWDMVYKNKKDINNFIYDKKYEILNIIKNFYDKSDWYKTKSIPFKKGILLSGPPGTGKSTFVSTLASELNLNIYYFNLSDPRIIKDIVKHASKVKPRSIVLFEDIDCLLMTQNRDFDNNNENLPSLLNILDGINSVDEVIYILTTNYIDKIDKALIRPGRIDLHIQMTNFKYDQIKEMYKMFYSEPYNNLDCLLFLKYLQPLLINDEIPPSTLQNLFLHFDNVQDLISKLKNSPDMIKCKYLRGK